MIFFFDYDGTLFVNGKVSGACIEALGALKRNGHILVLNTGRSYSVVPSDVKDHPLFDGMICGSTYLRFKNQVLFNKPLPVTVLWDVYEKVKKRKIPTFFEGVSKNYAYLLPMSSAEDAKELYSEEVLPEITKITFDCKGDEMDLTFPGLRLVKFKTYTEGIREGFDKSTLMKKLIEHLNINRQDTVAFGDSENDTDMLRYVEKAVIMKNAPASFDAFSFYRAESEDGVPEAIRKFFI